MEEGECELCGRFGRLVEVEIEGSSLLVCEKCAVFGEQPKRAGMKSKKARASASNEEVVEEVVEGYGMLIKNAREAKDITQEELASKLQIKASLLAKIERGEITPDLYLARRIERALGIKIVEKITAVAESAEEKGEEYDKKGGYSVTLGDLIKLKKMEKE